MNPRTQKVDPRAILSYQRLDIVCKYLYMRELLVSDGSIRPEIQHLYDSHIMKRTGGQEPPDLYGKTSLKKTIQDYHHAVKLLLESVKKEGFKAEHPVPYFDDGRLGNGAHRLAAALALGEEVEAISIKDGPGATWNFSWFQDHAFNEDELRTILYWYYQLKKDELGVFILFPPSLLRWKEMQKCISRETNIVGAIDFELSTALSCYELIHDLYGSYALPSQLDVINRKAIALAASQSKKYKVILVERKKKHRVDIHDLCTKIKKCCRELASALIPVNSFMALHAASSRTEADRMVDMLLSNNNLLALDGRRSYPTRPELLGWLRKCETVLAQENIPVNDVCVVGSTPLELHGIRQSTDLDITVKQKYRAKYGDGITKLSGMDIVTKGYHRKREGHLISDDELIDDCCYHFSFRGFKFANVNIVIDRKRYSARDKDLADVALFESATKAPQPIFEPALYQSIVSEIAIRAGGNYNKAVTLPKRQSKFYVRIRKLVRSALKYVHSIFLM